jgi:uncharacterized membrane protein YeaQ/YmgE (transglycosylase-associated protein family)
MIPEIFRSRRFWSAVIGLIAMTLAGIVPELQDHIDIIVPGIVGIVGVLIGGYAIEDALAARK